MKVLHLFLMYTSRSMNDPERSPGEQRAVRESDPIYNVLESYRLTFHPSKSRFACCPGPCQCASYKENWTGTIGFSMYHTYPLSLKRDATTCPIVVLGKAFEKLR